MSRISDVIESIDQHLTTFVPSTRGEMHDMMTEAHSLYESLGKAWQTIAENLADQPVMPGTREALAELGSATAGLGETADEAYQQHTTDHDMWLQD